MGTEGEEEEERQRDPEEDTNVSRDVKGHIQSTERMESIRRRGEVYGERSRMSSMDRSVKS